jgi:hypothetical protein
VATGERPLDWARNRVRRKTLLYGALLLNTELLILLGYALATGRVPDRPLYYYPFVWLNLGLWAMWRTDPRPASERDRWLAGAVAVGYFLVLAVVGGLVGTANLPVGVDPTGLRIVLLDLPPGYAPAVLYQGSNLRAALLPFKLVGYAALAYLVYATVLDATEAAAVGLLGLFACVSCTWPVFASVLTGVGGSTAAAAAVATNSYGVSTAVFAVTVGLLYWRPSLR